MTIVATLDDQVAFATHIARQPEIRRMRLKRELLFVALGPVFCLLGLVVGWALDGDRPPLVQFLGDLVSSDSGMALKGTVAGVGVMALCMALARLDAGRQRRRVVARILRAAPGVDASRPDLPQRFEAIFDGDGITSRTETASTQVRWGAIGRLDETAGHLFFISGLTGGFMVPKRALTGDDAERLRALAAAHIGPTGGGGPRP